MGESTEKTDSDGLQFLVGLGRQRLGVRVLNIFSRLSRPKKHFFWELQITDINFGELISDIYVLVIEALDLHFILLLQIGNFGFLDTYFFRLCLLQLLDLLRLGLNRALQFSDFLLQWLNKFLLFLPVHFLQFIINQNYYY